MKYSLGPFPPNLQIMVTCVGTNSIGSVSATRTITTFGKFRLRFVKDYYYYSHYWWLSTTSSQKIMEDILLQSTL